MQLLIIILCFFVFLYSLYTLGKDDYIFIRKNLSLEQLFDFGFIGLFAGIVLTKILSLVLHQTIGNDLVSETFSPGGASFTLAGVLAGSLLVVYFIGQYRRLPVGRLFDFFSISFLSSLPVGYLLSIFFVYKTQIFYYFFPGILYIGIQVFFWKFLYPRIISNRLKDGSLTCLFLLLFSLLSFATSFFYRFATSTIRIAFSDILLLLIFIVSIVFLSRNEKRRVLRGKR